MSEYLTHTDFTWGYRIKYPANWQKQALSPTKCGFLSPPESPNDIFRDNVIVSIDETIVSLRDYIDFEVAKLPSFAPTMQIGRRSALTIAGLPAEQLEISGQMGPLFRNNQPEMTPIRVLVLWVLKGKRVYRIEYTAEVRAYERFITDFRSMVESIELN